MKKLRTKDAVRVMNAERWLQDGEHQRALRELQGLSRRGWKHPWTEKVIWRAALQAG